MSSTTFPPTRPQQLPVGSVRTAVRPRAASGAPVTVAVIVLAVVVVDQLLKHWAWSTLSTARINSGGNQFVGSAFSDALRSPASGAVLDVVDAVLLALAVVLIARRPRSTPVLASAALLVGGWISNLLDRLVLHHWTAPGSVRGVVDYLPFAGHYWNLADLVIICGSVGLTGAVVAGGIGRLAAPRVGGRLAFEPRVPLRWRSPRLARSRDVAVLAGLLTIIVLAASGAMHYDGVSAPADVVDTAG